MKFNVNVFILLLIWIYKKIIYKQHAYVKITFILGDFNVKMYKNNKYIVHDNKTVCTKFSSVGA